MNKPGKHNFSAKAKKLLLTIVATAAIAGFFLLPANRVWVEKRIFSYWRDFNKQKKNSSLEYRKAQRHGMQYTMSKQIADSFHSKQNVLVLVPPSAYFKANELNYEVPEPGVFYYFTGLKTVTAKSANAARANWIVTVQNRMISVDSVNNGLALKDTIASWSKLTNK